MYFTCHGYAGAQVRQRYLFCENLDSLFENRRYVGDHLGEEMEGRSAEEVDCLERAISTSQILESDCRLQKFKDGNEQFIDSDLDDDALDAAVRALVVDLEAECAEQQQFAEDLERLSRGCPKGF